MPDSLIQTIASGDDIETVLSDQWFENLLVDALRDAVVKHGDAARIVGWSVREYFSERLPRGGFVYRGTDAITTGERNG